MDKQNLIKKCLINSDATETYPWQKDEYKDCCVMRHKSNNKWFGLIFEKNGELCINVKCPPDIIAVLKEQYEAVKPAWHMNKKHWCTILGNKIPEDVLKQIIKISFDITSPKQNRNMRI